MEIKVIPSDLLTLCESYGTNFIFMGVQKVGEILIWKKSNFLGGAFLLASSISHSWKPSTRARKDET